MQIFWKVLSVLCFLALIAAGIVAKRVYGHPELVPAFHIPAALTLVWAVSLNKNQKKETAYAGETEKLRRRQGISSRSDMYSQGANL